MSDVTERLDTLEADRTERRRRWIAAAAKSAGLHDPALAAKLIDSSTIVTNGDAERAVQTFVAEHPYFAPEKISEEEQRRRWGQELLDAIDRS